VGEQRVFDHQIDKKILRLGGSRNLIAPKALHGSSLRLWRSHLYLARVDEEGDGQPRAHSGAACIKQRHSLDQNLHLLARPD
jgi:hypothetical protein